MPKRKVMIVGVKPEPHIAIIISKEPNKTATLPKSQKLYVYGYGDDITTVINKIAKQFTTPEITPNVAKQEVREICK